MNREEVMEDVDPLETSVDTSPVREALIQDPTADNERRKRERERKILRARLSIPTTTEEVEQAFHLGYFSDRRRSSWDGQERRRRP